MCLRINQDTGLEEVGEEEGEGRDPSREAISAILKYLDSTLPFSEDEGWTGNHRHGEGGGLEGNGSIDEEEGTILGPSLCGEGSGTAVTNQGRRGAMRGVYPSRPRPL